MFTLFTDDQIRPPHDSRYSAHFNKLMKRGGIDGLSDEVALSATGTLIDVSTDVGREDGIGLTLQCCDEVAQRTLNDADATLIEYFRES